MQPAYSNDQLQEMLRAMNEVNDASNEIGEVIKTIQNISSQTNTLALNAAIEAARAGEAGKGFAIVAQEVRMLAGKSAKASENTAAMIENSLKTIQSGSKIAQSASDTFLNVMVNAGKAAEAMGGISVAANEQSEGIVEITSTIASIVNVVQNNSATSEESAAASERLAEQAEVLRKLVQEFKLKQ